MLPGINKYTTSEREQHTSDIVQHASGTAPTFRLAVLEMTEIQSPFFPCVFDFAKSCFYRSFFAHLSIVFCRGDSATLFVGPKSLIGGSSLSNKETMEGVVKKALSQKVSAEM